MAISRVDLLPIIPFDEITSGTEGVLVKAGFQDTDADDNGIGTLGSIVGGNAADFSASSGGLRKTTGSGYIKQTLSAAQGASLAMRGTVQFDFNKSEFINNVAASSLAIMRSFNAAGSVRGGPQIITSFTAATARTSYRQYTKDVDQNHIYNPAVGMTSDSIFMVLENPIAVIHDQTPGDWVMSTFSWDGNELIWMINGIPIGMGRHKKNVSSGVVVPSEQLRFFETVSSAFAEFSIRNLVVMNAPRINPMDRPWQKRVVFLTHSFGTTGSCFNTIDPIGPWATIIGSASLESIIPSVFMHQGQSINVRCVGMGSKDSTWFLNQVDRTQATPYEAYQPALTATAVTISGDGTTATVTHTAHGRQTGDYQTIAGVTQSEMNGTKLITVTSADAYTYASTTNGAAAGSPTAVPTVKDRVMRWRPHIVVIMGHMNDGVAATLATNITAINTYLTDNGVVPIWVQEQNGDAANPAIDRAAVAPTIGTQVAADIVSLSRDIGYVDCWTTFGGATVDRTLVENNTTGLHWNWKGSSKAGPLIAAEINRILASPPAYAWWA